MPFKSKAQLGFLFARHPQVAKDWVRKYGVPKTLPQHVSSEKMQTKRNAKHWNK